MTFRILGSLVIVGLILLAYWLFKPEKPSFEDLSPKQRQVIQGPR